MQGPVYSYPPRVTAFLQKADGGISITNGRLSLIRGPQEKAQKIRGRLLLGLGEWFLNSLVGVPYFEAILVSAPRIEILKRIFRDVILSVPGVAEVAELELTYNRGTRVGTLTWRAFDDEGTEIPGGDGEPFIVRAG